MRSWPSRPRARRPWRPGLLCVCGWLALASAPAHADARLLRAIAAELPAFDLKSGPLSFDSSNLWSHINGDADRYLAYHFQWNATGVLERRDTGEGATIDVYCFASALDAFGAHSMDRSPSGSVDVLALPGGTSPLAAYLAVDQLRLWRGRYAVVISPRRRATPLPELALEIGRAACRVLPPHAGLPRLLRLCPPEGMRLATLRYQTANVFGRADLTTAALASYGTPADRDHPDTRCDLAVFAAASVSAATALRERLAAMLRDGGTVQAAPDLGEGVLAADHPRFGRVWLCARGDAVVMVYRAHDPAAARDVLQRACARAAARP